MAPPVSSLAGERVLAELGWVRKLARSLVRDPGIADDVVQEAWLLALERPPAATSEGGLRAWLARVTRTLVRTRMRSERARALREELRGRRKASEPSASEVVERTQQEQRVVAALMELAEPYRSAVLLRHVDGLSARAIAERQGTSVENARQRVARGLALLRSSLDREHGNDGRAWVLALVPSLRQSGPLAAASALLGGPVLVKTTSTVVAAVAAAVLAAFLVRSALVREPAPEVSGAEPAPAPALIASEAQRGERSVTTEVSAVEPAREVVLATEAAPAKAPLRVRARLIDARGTPLAGAELAQPDTSVVARSNAKGEVELVLAEPVLAKVGGGETLLAFVARAARCRDALRYEPPPSGDVLELGELRLYPIGALGGIVRDVAGRPVADADVRLGLPSNADERRTRLFGPEYSLQERRGKTDADGRFLYDDVGEGVWCLWAGAAGMAWTRTEALRVDSADGVQEIALVLEPLPEEALIRGTVRGASAGPLADIEVYATRHGAREAESWAVTDAQGRFVLAAAAGAPHRVRAEEREARGKDCRHGAATLEDVVPGTGEVVLVLPEARWLDVSVVDPKGKRVPNAIVREEHESPTGDRFYPLAVQGPRAGIAHVQVPEVPFELAIQAPEFTSTRVGPFDPLALPAELRVELAPLAKIRGTVRSGGEPVAEARVQLMQLARPGSTYYLYGFPARLDGMDLQGTVTDAAGRFELAIPFANECALFAEKDGYAAVERSPLRLDPARDETIDLELTQGGAVEGRVLVPDGESAAGILVQLCRGDMRTHEAATDAEGRYRIERLTPGPYMVLAERKRAGRSFGFLVSPIEPIEREDFEFPWALEVRSGETTRHDVDLAAQDRCTIAGRLRIDGAAPLAAILSLLKPDECPWPRRFDTEQGALAADGSFAIEERRREGLVLAFEIGAGPLRGTTVVVPLDPERGENRVDLDLESASVRGRLPAGESGPFALVTELGPGVVGVTPIPVTAGNFTLEQVPASATAKLVGWRTGANRDDPRTWNEFGRCELAAGRWSEMP